MVIEQGNPKCFFSKDVPYDTWAAAWPKFGYAGTATIEEYPSLKALHIFGGFSQEKEEVYHIGADDGLVR
jgi:hypothetical protein